MFTINTPPAVLNFVPATRYSIQAVSSAAYDAVTLDDSQRFDAKVKG
jgi:hypothetical protein